MQQSRAPDPGRQRTLVRERQELRRSAQLRPDGNQSGTRQGGVPYLRPRRRPSCRRRFRGRHTLRSIRPAARRGAGRGRPGHRHAAGTLLRVPHPRPLGQPRRHGREGLRRTLDVGVDLARDTQGQDTPVRTAVRIGGPQRLGAQQCELQRPDTRRRAYRQGRADSQHTQGVRNQDLSLYQVDEPDDARRAEVGRPAGPQGREVVPTSEASS